MNFKRLLYFIKEGLLSSAKNKAMTLAAIATEAVALFVLGAGVLLLAQLQSVLQEIQKQVEVGIFLKKQVDRTEAEILKARLASQAGVDQVIFVDRETSLRQLLQELGSRVDLQEIIDENPLPHALRVKARDPVVLERIAQEIAKKDIVDEVVYPQKIVKRLHRVFLAGKTSALGVIIFLLLAATILIVNTIRLSVFARRKEIRIMQLVGATNWFIRTPFIIEGIFQGLAGALLASLAIFFFYRSGLSRLPEIFPFLFSPLPFSLVEQTSLMLFASGTILGTVGSIVAVGSHLEEP